MSTTFLQFCVTYSSIALLYYDYLLTFPAEVQYIWSRKPTLSTILYICCRYALLANLLYLFAIAKVVNNCDSWYTAIGFISVAGRAAILTIFTARTWAIYGKSRIVLFGLSTIAVGCIAVDLWHASGETCTGPTPPNIKTQRYSLCNIANTALPIIMAIFEFIGTVLNVLRCFKAVQQQRKCGRRLDDSFMSFMLNESLLYFCGTFFITLTSVVLHFEEPDGFMSKLLNGLTLPVTGLLSARLILNLRQWSDEMIVHTSVGLPANMRQPSPIGLSFHAATHLTGSDEFGGDPLDYVYGSLGFDDEIIRRISMRDDGDITEINRVPSLSHS